MKVSAKRMAVLREHVRAESEHNTEALLSGMTPDCFNDVVGVPKPFVGPEQTAERYPRHWEGFPDFAVRVRRVLCADESWLAGNRKAGAHARDCSVALQGRRIVGRDGVFRQRLTSQTDRRLDRCPTVFGTDEAGHIQARRSAADRS